MRATTLLVVGLAALAACSDAHNQIVYTPDGPAPLPPKIAALVVSPNRLSLVRGGNSRLTATAKDALGAVVPNVPIAWTSSDTSVATVSDAGMIHAQKLGSVSITASADQVQMSAAVTVSNASVATVSVSLAATSIQVGATTQANAVIRDSTGALLTDRAITWSSSSSGIATVSVDGVVTGVAAGTATIVGTSEGKTGQATMTVTAAPPPPPAPVASVTVSLNSSSLTVGQSTQASAVLRDASGNVLTGRTVTWSSSNTNAATVNSSGLVTSVAAGTSNIVATSEGITGQATVTVTAVAPPPVASVTVTLNSSSITSGQATQATAVLKDASGNVLTGRSIAWSSSNTGVATVNSSGLVSSVAAGSANIVATSEGISGQATVTVTTAAPPPVASVTVSLGSSNLTAGQTTQATAVLKDASGNILTGRTITWSSSNTSVATVSSSGLVTSVGAGSANIVATSEGITGQAGLTVIAAVSSVTVSLGSSSLNTGQTTQASAVLKDAGGNVLTGRTVTWTSSNTAVATVNSSGLVTALTAGSANIVATSSGVSGQSTLTVTLAPVASITVTLGSSTVPAGQTTQATAVLQDASGNVLTGRTVTWASSNTAVATVSSSGLVSAVATGSATISATSGTVSGNAAMTVTTPPPPGSLPNEPSGFTTLTDVNWSSLTPSGWGNTGLSNVSVVSDATAPFSPSQVLHINYPIGFSAGTEPVTTWFDIPGTAPKELYIGYWIKVSNPWQGHPSGVNKIMFITTGGTQEAVLMVLFGGSAPYELRYEMEMPSVGPTYWLDQNVSSPTFTLGVWHRVEIYLKYGTSGNGILKSWLDGTQIMNYTNITYPYDGFDGFKYAPTWGGTGGSKTENDYFRIDHTHASRP